MGLGAAVPLAGLGGVFGIHFDVLPCVSHGGRLFGESFAANPLRCDRACRRSILQR